MLMVISKYTHEFFEMVELVVHQVFIARVTPSEYSNINIIYREYYIEKIYTQLSYVYSIGNKSINETKFNLVV